MPTLVPVDPFYPNDDAAQLFNSIDGWGTDENKIVSILCYRTASQRDEITTAYNNQHGVQGAYFANFLQKCCLNVFTYQYLLQ